MFISRSVKIAAFYPFRVKRFFQLHFRILSYSLFNFQDPRMKNIYVFHSGILKIEQRITENAKVKLKKSFYAKRVKSCNFNWSRDEHMIQQLLSYTAENGQATKGAGRMPWHQRPKKDVVSCEKLRGAASRHWSVDIWMEQSGECHDSSSYTESNRYGRGTAWTETSK